MLFLFQVNVDGTWQEMVSLYPKVDTQGAKTLFKFRFPKFNSSVTYDPTVSLSSDSSSGGNGSVVTQGIIIIIIFGFTFYLHAAVCLSKFLRDHILIEALKMRQG